MSVFQITRRRLLTGATGAVVLAGAGGLWLGVGRLADRSFRQAVDRGGDFAPNVYLAVQADGDVVVWLTRAEMGQGVMTALPLIIAEELDADWSRVRVEQAVAGPDFDYGRMLTVASSSIASQWIELRRAGATARSMLLAAAASQWGVPVGQCRTESGEVRHDRSDRVAGYGELALAAAGQRAPFRPRLKSPADFRLIGNASIARLDVPAKVCGEARYGLDVRVPDMLFCVIARPPTRGGRLQAVDPSAALEVPGVIDVLTIDAGVAVIARDTHAALRGRSALALDWTPGPWAHLGSDEVSAALHARLEGAPAGIARDDDGALGALEAADRRVNATYEVPFLAHATMEPMNCVAHVADGRCEVWVPTQAPQDARERAAQVAGLPIEQVRVNSTLLGGGFGRRTATDFVAEAVDVSRRLGRPVQVVWSREDDFRNGEFRDASVHRFEAALDQSGRPSAWRHHAVTAADHELPPGEYNWAAVMGATDASYDLGRARVEWSGVPSPVPLRIWRSVGHSSTCFAVESFIDELATESGRDPLRFRVELLAGSPRLQACVERVAAMSDWKAARAQGRWLGVAVVRCFGSHVAQVAEVVTDGAGGLRVADVWCAVDCGIAVHPDNVRAQIEGGILFGLSAALHEQVTIRDGAVIEGNYDSYRLLRLRETPKVHVDIMPSAEGPTGVGEAGVPPIAPAVANAVFLARGERARRLPIAI